MTNEVNQDSVVKDWSTVDRNEVILKEVYMF